MLFYYQKLNAFEKNVYKLILCGIEKISPIINILGVSELSLSRITNAILMDNPTIFYVKDYQFSSNGIKQYIAPQYLYSKEDIIDLRKRIESMVLCIIQNFRGNHYQKLLSIHDYVCKNVKYLDVEYRLSHTCIGPVCNNSGVCEGFAKYFKILCDNVGINCIVVNGKAKGTNNRVHLENHAWNKVYINNNWFNVDTTFDTTLSTDNFIRHDYFLVSDESIKNTHYGNHPSYFVANSESLDFYNLNHLLMLNQKEYINFIKQNIKNNNFVFEIKIPGTNNIDAVEDKILFNTINVLQELKLSRQLEISFNKDRLVALVNIK